MIKKRVLFITPGNLNRMPYIKNYNFIIKDSSFDCTILNWDRNLTEEISKFTYRDNRNVERRSYFDYMKYSKYCINIIKKEAFDYVIVFGIQLTYFLGSYVQKKYNNRYLIDIRDIHKLVFFPKVRHVIKNASLVILSSPGFRQSLPKREYLINHNVSFTRKIKNKNISKSKFKYPIKIAYIGTIRDYSINIKLINNLKDNLEFNLLYHGKSDLSDKIKLYSEKNTISNVSFTGEYLQSHQDDLYLDADLINIILPNNDINSRLLLPNRLYNAVLHNKPILTLRGTYLAKIVDKYNLGLVVDNLQDIPKLIPMYISNFNEEHYSRNKEKFMKKVEFDNCFFNKAIMELIS